ncbi:polyphosphate kinase 1 [Butyricicoccus pullicaecorum]|uniref:Polyphosphate kinase n=1 Tax=Butyricicoccus pullicaecorum 1.2 TaxID=1203606 RepID=R8VS33_9FIRM|nr:polyphosphate kinase 1 [Butyricicoccus pullicaecorum]EOQ35299.1 polyphosphate kinase 1 [Butyricicoccus pullicaecorum 1.2]SKA64518.1 polyphosphate kinase [Butyricicoccus pullicaecorum DSM 23266]
MPDTRFTQNRELSWLRFNERVLMEATDETVPLLERLKFIAIFTSNLDEFFMIRVGSLFDLSHFKTHTIDQKSGWTPGEQLTHIYEAVRVLYARRQQIYQEVEQQLRVHGICQLHYDELAETEVKFVRQYFKSSIAPILSPQIVDTHHPFPHLQNKALHIGAWLKYKNNPMFAVIPVPAALPEVIFLPGGETRYIRTEEVILEHVSQIFKDDTILEKTVFCVTRNADINPDDEAFDFDSDDFRGKMKKLLRQRQRLAPVRLELSRPISETFLKYLKEHLPVTQEQVYVTNAPLKMGYAFALPAKLSENKRRALTDTPFTPGVPHGVRLNAPITPQVQAHDILLSYPFEGMDTFLHLIRESAYDPDVISIKITIYRLARKAKLVEYLCAAAEAGKDVTAFIELRARFDEQNNIDWSERLEDAGCTVIYGVENYKVHSKVCLITRRSQGSVQYITQVGTGNYNEKTALQYTDLSLITANPAIGQDANHFFQNLAIGNVSGQYEHLMVAPSSLKTGIIREIDREIAKRGEGRIFIKMNAITDIDLIEKLKQASCAGVRVRMIVRGICCILPDIPEKTENIEVISIVGRFLEHSRVYCFGQGNDERMYIASADFMTRNTEKRVEVACPIYDQAVREKIHYLMDTCWADNVKARALQRDGSYRTRPIRETPIDSQQMLMAKALEPDDQMIDLEPDKKHGFMDWLTGLFHGHKG